MTRVIAFISALLLLPLLYGNAVAITPDNAVGALARALLDDWRGALFLILFGYPAMFFAGHAVWLVCRLFNFTMKKLG